MQFPVTAMLDAERELLESHRYHDIRVMTTGVYGIGLPYSILQKWAVASPESLRNGAENDAGAVGWNFFSAAWSD